jgi:branched-chain amino acid transport system ATP-binding protein
MHGGSVPVLAAGQPVLELRDIWAGYGETTVLRGVDLVVPAASVVAVLGPNGAGKSTLLRVASGLLQPKAGTRLVGGEDTNGEAASALVGRGLCHIPDPRGIFRSLTVAENLTLQAPKGRAAESIDRAVSVFPRLGERLAQRAGTLSGGEQQMLAVTRAYVQNPAVVLLDEVSTGLAPKVVDEIFVFLERLAAEGAALLLVEQFVHRALAIADRVSVLDRGVIRLTGNARDLTEEQIFASYAGMDSNGHGYGQEVGH